MLRLPSEFTAGFRWAVECAGARLGGGELQEESSGSGRPSRWRPEEIGRGSDQPGFSRPGWAAVERGRQAAVRRENKVMQSQIHGLPAAV